MNNERDDEGLHDEALSRAYRHVATDGPPPALDALILAAAHREAVPRPLARGVPWWRRALAPVGVLASVVVTVSLVLMIEREQHDLLPASAPASMPVAEPELAKPAVPTELSAKKKEETLRQAPAPRTAAVPTRTAPLAPAPASAPALVPAPTQDSVPKSSPTAAESIGDAKSIYGETRSEPAQSAAGAASAEKKFLPEVLPVAAPPPAAADVAESRARAVQSAPRREAGVADKMQASRTPENWIEDIRRLRREGHEAEAKAQLTAFRLAYPDYRLPDDLKAP